MIFTEIVLHNFGIYKGRHTVDLKPKSLKKPIILFGGLNGGGKTTFLDALQLTLYGKFAKCSSRTEVSYKAYLRDAINTHVDPNEGAALELEFIHHSEGNETTYRIKRFWKSTGKSIDESMEVLKDGHIDTVMSEQWYEYVDEFIPSNISNLFFFDGEQIESLADPASSAEIIQTGIMSLLGLDLVDKLREDLETVKRRRTTAAANNKTSKTIRQLENDVHFLQENTKQHKEKLAGKFSTIDSLERQIISSKKTYKKQGGELYDQREMIINEHRHQSQQLNDIENRIRKYSEGPAPLLLVEDLIQRAQKQSEKESASMLNRDVISVLEERDLDVIGQFSEKSNQLDTVNLLIELLGKDRAERSKSAKETTPLNVHEDILKPLTKTFFAQLKNEAKQLKLAHELLVEELASSDKKLSTIPEADMIREISQQLKSVEDSHKVAQGESIVLQQVLDESTRALLSKQNEMDRLLHTANEEQLNDHRNKHILEHTAEVQKTLSLYREALVNKHIGRLETLITESFKSLIRKSDLINMILISPIDFSLMIFSPQNEPIPANRLSAGERQLLAISVLWGLAKASGRPLPAIIDTPLGRLDSKHRTHLVNNYFPNASHQVILLSTDTEIDRKYRDDLAKSIGKEYHIQYQEQQQSSTITPGYF